MDEQSRSGVGLFERRITDPDRADPIDAWFRVGDHGGDSNQGAE